jgi:integrase
LKKEPKNFCSLRCALDRTRAPICKSFCFFFQKEALSCLLRVNLYAAWYKLLLALPDAGANAYGDALRLILWTAARKSEVTGMRWQELDHDTGEWTVPEDRMKATRESARRPHTRKLPRQALALLAVGKPPRAEAPAPAPSFAARRSFFQAMAMPNWGIGTAG